MCVFDVSLPDKISNSERGSRWSQHGHTCEFEVSPTQTKRDVHTAVVVAMVMATATVVAVAMEAVAMVMEAVDKYFIFRLIFN